MIAAADMNAAADGIARDIDELLASGLFGIVVLTIIFALPVASLVAVLFQRWLALVSFVISLGLGVLWVAYYAIGLLSPQSGPGGVALAVLLALTGWAWLVLSLRWPKKTRTE